LARFGGAFAPGAAPKGAGSLLFENDKTVIMSLSSTEKHPAKGRPGQLQTATEQTLELLGVVVGTVADEHGIRARFAAHRIRGEWFVPAQEILAYFQENHS
jgi:hypothetical protein